MKKIIITASPKPRSIRAGMKAKKWFQASHYETLSGLSLLRSKSKIKYKKPRVFNPRKLIKDNKIDVITKYFFPITAGIEINIFESYNRLAKMGWDITIHASSDTYLDKNSLLKEERIGNLKVKRYQFKWYGFSPKINYSKTNLVCLHNFNIFPHAYILLRATFLKLVNKKKFKLFLTPHGGFNPEWSIFSRLQTLIKKNYHYSVGVFLINFAVDRVRAVSEWEKKEMISRGVKKGLIIVLKNGLEDEAYLNVDKLASNEIKIKVESFGKYIIQIGRIHRIKNYETTIKALAALPRDINFIIAGPLQEKDLYINELNAQVKSLKLENRVRFIGVVRGVDKYYLMKHAKAMIHMALWESYCNVVHEGLSQGLVCIVSNNTALPYLIKDGINGYCVETRNDVEVANKIKLVLQTEKAPFIKKMKNLNKKEARKESWENIAIHMNKIYRDLVAKN